MNLFLNKTHIRFCATVIILNGMATLPITVSFWNNKYCPETTSCCYFNLSNRGLETCGPPDLNCNSQDPASTAIGEGGYKFSIKRATFPIYDSHGDSVIYVTHALLNPSCGSQYKKQLPAQVFALGFLCMLLGRGKKNSTPLLQRLLNFKKLGTLRSHIMQQNKRFLRKVNPPSMYRNPKLLQVPPFFLTIRNFFYL